MLTYHKTYPQTFTIAVIPQQLVVLVEEWNRNGIKANASRNI